MFNDGYAERRATRLVQEAMTGFRVVVVNGLGVKSPTPQSTWLHHRFRKLYESRRGSGATR
jgi:hypothetical protein